MKKQGLVFVVCGPSGSGKSTLVGGLLRDRQLRKRLVKSVSFTTRPKRCGEKEGKDYFFIGNKVFKARLSAKKILEWTRYLGYYYGTPREFVEEHLRKGRNIILCLDFRGVLQLKRILPRSTVTIFILPPSVAALRPRIRERCHLTKEGEIRQRLRLAKRELALAPKFDYRLRNKNLKQTTKALKKIILGEIGAAA